MRRTFPLTIHETLIVTSTLALLAAVVTPRVLVPRVRAAPSPVMTPTPVAVEHRPPAPFGSTNPGVIFYTTGTTLALDTSTCVLPSPVLSGCGGPTPKGK